MKIPGKYAFSNLIATLSMIIAVVLLLSGCGISVNGNSKLNDGKIKVIATLFPQYDFVREIAKDKADVRLLLPPGVESHSYEPSPQDIVSIRKSDVFIYTGKVMEPWAQRIIDKIKSDTVVIVDSSKGVVLYNANDPEHGGKDPHIWLDPVLAKQMVDNIADGLVKADPSNEKFYRDNATNYKVKLQELDSKFEELVTNSSTDTIMYGGHFAFGYFARRYNLRYLSPYNGFAPNSEPTPKRIAELITNMEQAKTKVIFYEELIDPKVARVISDQTGAKMLILHGAHNISKEELSSGITYIEIMYQNLENLKTGLDYKKK